MRTGIHNAGRYHGDALQDKRDLVERASIYIVYVIRLHRQQFARISYIRHVSQ